MRYELFSPVDPGRPLATTNLDHDFDAEQWARQWVLDHKDEGDDFNVRGAEGTFAATVFRTAAGQCYIMRQPIGS